jgi:hypothetical protein
VRDREPFLSALFQNSRHVRRRRFQPLENVSRVVLSEPSGFAQKVALHVDDKQRGVLSVRWKRPKTSRRTCFFLFFFAFVVLHAFSFSSFALNVRFPFDRIFPFPQSDASPRDSIHLSLLPSLL